MLVHNKKWVSKQREQVLERGKTAQAPAYNGRFGVMAAVARRKCSANLQGSTSQEV